MKLKDIGPKVTTKKMNNIMESRFGFAIDYSKLTMTKATNLRNLVNENIDKIRHSYASHTVEKNPKYMELFMISEALGHWISKQKQLTEGEIGKSEAILAAKDMVDSIQDMLEKVSRMQIEQMPALVDTIRDQISLEQADSFKNTIGQLLTGMMDQLGQAREQADLAARQLAGEAAPQQNMAMPGADLTTEPSLDMPELPPENDFDQDEIDGDDTQVDLGREQR
jgi:hypothetical protein